MLALLTPFLGILGSLLPSIIQLFEKKQELQYELQLANIQIQAAATQANIQLAITDAQADANDEQSVRSNDSSPSDGIIINAIKASIRPVITYCFFFLFVAVKGSAAWVLFHSGFSIPSTITTVWDDNTTAIFGTILGYWFGNRTLEAFGYAGYKPRNISVVPITPTPAPAPKKLEH
jgi:hypothetical protein